MLPKHSIKFLCDMGVSHTVNKWLKQHEYDSLHLIDEKLFTLSDELIFEKAAKENRIVLTFDLDFGEILSRIKAHQPSVIIFRLENQTPANIIHHLELILKDHLNSLNEGVIFIVTEKKYRVRRLPIINK
ncbi:MAG: DUF5615 family PIN-like protein [Bacteroidota bacterium]